MRNYKYETILVSGSYSRKYDTTVLGAQFGISNLKWILNSILALSPFKFSA